MSTEAVVNEFFNMYERVLAEHDLKDMPDQVICLKDKCCHRIQNIIKFILAISILSIHLYTLYILFFRN